MKSIKNEIFVHHSSGIFRSKKESLSLIDLDKKDVTINIKLNSDKEFLIETFENILKEYKKHLDAV